MFIGPIKGQRQKEDELGKRERAVFMLFSLSFLLEEEYCLLAAGGKKRGAYMNKLNLHFIALKYETRVSFVYALNRKEKKEEARVGEGTAL